MGLLDQATDLLQQINPIESTGVVTDITGLVIEASGPAVGLGTTCQVIQGEQKINAQVVGFKKDKVLLMPYGSVNGLAPGALIKAAGRTDYIPAGYEYLGRVISPLGEPLDNKPLPVSKTLVPLFRESPPPLDRKRITEPFDVGVKVVNSLLRVGRGQRMAIMAGSGVGKSTFLGMIAKHAKETINVIALVGERGREVREFIEKDLGEEGLKRSVVVVATSDSSALMRIRAAFYATAIAEYFRDQGENVSLMVDSITRLCMSQREVGLAVGEPPSTSGYTPSVFAMLPKLLERSGNCGGEGSITAFYTVLVEGDDMNEPIADAVRGILDGHIILSRKLAGKGHYPAVDVLQSVSRLIDEVSSKEELELSRIARRVLADYAEVEDLITIGAYREGQNAKIDYAVRQIEGVRGFLVQYPEEKFIIEDCDVLLKQALN